MSKWYLISFTLVILIFSVTIGLFLLLNLEYLPNPCLIANYSMEGAPQIFTISKMCNICLLSAPSFIIISLIMIFIINKYLVFELNNKTIFYWLTSTKSRKNIIIWKIVFINCFLLILLLPITIVLTFLGLKSLDKDIYIQNLFKSLFTYMFMLFSFTNLYILMGVLWHKKVFLYNSILIIFLFLVLSLFLFDTIYKPRESNNKTMIAISYLSIETFYYNCLHFGMEYVDSKIYIRDLVLYQFKLEENNVIIYLILLFIQILCLILSLILSVKKFINLEFYI